VSIDLVQFLQGVELGARLDREAAARATKAVLATLGEYSGSGPAAKLAAKLPQRLRGPLGEAPAEGEAFGPDEFVGRVAAREGVDHGTAATRSRAVLRTLRANVAAFEGIGLPDSYDPLLRQTL
jgi:uncharacterized protein (DUF2267 family)